MSNIPVKQMAEAIRNRKPYDILKNDANISFRIKPSVVHNDGFRLNITMDLKEAPPEIKHLVRSTMKSKRSFANFMQDVQGRELDHFTISTEFTSFCLSPEKDSTSYYYKDLKDKKIQSGFLEQFVRSQLIEPLRESMVNVLQKEVALELGISRTRLPVREGAPSLKEKINNYIDKLVNKQPSKESPGMGF